MAQAVRRELTELLSRPETWREVIQEVVQSGSRIDLRLPALVTPRRTSAD